MFQAFVNFFLDTLFPIRCLSCGQDNAWLCQQCLEKIPSKTEQVCPECEKRITPQGRTCLDCRSKYSIDGILVASSYQIDLVSRLVHLYKYRFVEDLHVVLGDILIRTIQNSELALPDCVIPVPLHPRRLRWRGFNQAKLLANYLSANLAPGLPIPVLDNFLNRTRWTHPQMQIKNHQQRQKNITGAFVISQEGKEKITGKNILLVDDVATTGSTLFECAKILKVHGAKTVFGLVIARQEYRKKFSP